MIDDFVKSIKTVMPDLIRHPEDTEITGFRPQSMPGFKWGWNDALEGFQAFYDFIND